MKIGNKYHFPVVTREYARMLAISMESASRRGLIG
jgi:hypothetical protein